MAEIFAGLGALYRRMHYDVRLKSILYGAMPRLFRMLGLAEVVEYLTIEFPVRQRRLPDLVVRLADGRILHIEFQSKNDLRMIWRCLEYYQAIAGLWPDAEIVQVVIYLGDGPLKMASSITRDRLVFGFEMFNLQEVDASAFLESESDDERMLAVLCRSEDPRATIVAILASWKHLPPKELAEKINDLQVLSQLRNRDTMVKEELSTMPIEIDVTENAMFKWGEEMGAAKGEARGEARGEAKGEARGEARGEAKGEARTLTRLLERRFGQLPESIRSRISTADIESLDRWVDRLDGAASLDAIFRES